MQKLLIVVILSFSFFSCNDRVDHLIYYQYEDRCITRVDYATSSYFYIGKLSAKDVSSKKWILKIMYPGFDNDFVAYLNFGDDKYIFYRLYGQYEVCRDCKNVILIDDHIYDYRKFTTQRSMEVNTVCIASALKTEKEENSKKPSSTISVEYVY